MTFIRHLFQIFLLFFSVEVCFCASNRSFEVKWYDGRDHSLDYERSIYGDCLYSESSDVLKCMRNYKYKSIVDTWRFNPEVIKYVSVRCQQQEYFAHHRHVCMCKNGSRAANPVYSQQLDEYYFCQINRLTENLFSTLPNLEVIDLYNNSISHIEGNSFNEATSLKYLNLGRNPFRSLPGSLLCDSLDLEVLIMENTQLDTFPAHIFDCSLPFEKLTYIDLSDGIMENVPITSLSKIPNLQSLQLSGNRLKKIHILTFRPIGQLQFLDLSANDFAKFPEGICEPLKSLEHVLLRENHMTILNISHIRNCVGISHLDLSFNQIGHIIGDSGTVDLNLKFLNMSHNALRVLNDDFLVNAIELSIVDFSVNDIHVISKNAFKGLGNLKWLNMSGNSINNNVSLEVIFDPLENLTTLDLSRNYINRVTDGMFESLGSLVALNLSRNLLGTLHSNALRGLVSLRTLILSYNLLRTLPTDLFGPTQRLEFVDLSNNGIIQFDNFEIPKSLRNVDLFHNDIEQFPFTFGNTGVSFLNLSANSLSTLQPKNMVNLNSLTVLDLSRNQITGIQPRSFLGLPKLVHLDLKSNNLDLNMSIDIFHGASKLKHLDLSVNDIQSIDGIFTNPTLQSLRTLSVSRNNITSLGRLGVQGISSPTLHFQIKNIDLSSCVINDTKVDTFVGLSRLKHVDLSHNKIEEFQPFHVVPGVHFDLTSNPLQCTCKMEWISNYYVNIGTTRYSTFDYGVDTCTLFPKKFKMAIRKVPKDKFLCDTKVACDFVCSCFARGMDETINTVHCSPGLTRLPRFIANTTKSLYLDGNQFRRISGDVSNGYNMDTIELYLNSSGIQEISNKFLMNFVNLTTIDLSSNHLANIESYTFVHQSKLKKLILSHNFLTGFKKDAFLGLTSLRRLDLTFNKIQILDSTSLSQFSVFYRTYLVKLDDNPFKCTCANHDFQKWIEAHRSRVLDRREIMCTGSKQRERILIDVKFSACANKEVTSINNNQKGIITVVVILFVMMVVLAAAIFYYRRDLLAVLYAKLGFGCLRSNFDSSKIHDSFVIYDTNDNKCTEWINQIMVKKLQKLSKHKSYRLVVPDKMRLLESVVDLESHQIYDSKSAMFIVSSSFAGNNWATECFRKACSYKHENKKFKILLVVYGDLMVDALEPEMKQMLQKGDYITARSRSVFDRLLYELPDPQKSGSLPQEDDVSESDVIIYNATAQFDDGGGVFMK